MEAKKWKLIYKRVRLSSDVLEDFKDKDIARLWYEGKRVKRMPPYLELLDILQILNNDIKHPLELRNLLPPLLIKYLIWTVYFLLTNRQELLLIKLLKLFGEN